MHTKREGFLIEKFWYRDYEVNFQFLSENKRLKITQLEKVHFFYVNELKLTQVELFSSFNFRSASVNVSELLCVAL